MTRTVDLRASLGPVRQQGPFRGTCLAFAVSAVHEPTLDHVDQLCVEVLYWGAKQHDGDPRPGTTFEAANKALTRWGQPPEPFWPYDPFRTDTDGSYQPPADAIDPANCHSAELTPITIDASAIRAAIDADTPVAIGAPTWPGLRRPAGGHLANPGSAELDGEYHAMVVVGYRLDTNELLLRNSWGPAWGDEGHAWIPFGFVTDHVIAAWQIGPPHPASTSHAPQATATFGHSHGP